MEITDFGLVKRVRVCGQIAELAGQTYQHVTFCIHFN